MAQKRNTLFDFGLTAKAFKSLDRTEPVGTTSSNNPNSVATGAIGYASSSGTGLMFQRYYIHRRWQVLEDLGIPHDPPSVLGLGNLRSQFKKPLEFFKQDLEYKKKYGKVYGSYRGLEARITLWDPLVLKQIQIKQFSKFSTRQKQFRKLGGKYLNTALTATVGDQWKRIRHTLTPTFSTSKLKEMLGIVVQCSDHMVDNLLKKVTEDNGLFDTKETFGKLSLQAICSAAFGVDVFANQENGEEPKVLKMAKKLFGRSLLAKPLTLLFLISSTAEKIAELCQWSFFPSDIMSYMARLIEAMIEKKRCVADKARVDILKCMLDTEIDEKDTKKSDKGISRTELLGNSILMLLAGYDTTSNAMQFLVYNLAVYPECQETLREQIKDAVQKHDGLTYEAINNMPYLMMCLNESMRLYPPVLRNTRYCDEDVIVEGMKIPKGAHIDIPVYGLTRDPEYWDEPLIFKPQRMEDMSKIDPLVFQPFGVGPRNCIGMRFALMEIKMAICKLLLTFQLDPAEDTPKPPLDIIFKASMRPKIEALHLRVSPLT